jgi:hypothetical protein
MRYLNYALIFCLLAFPSCGQSQNATSCEAILKQKMNLENPESIFSNIRQLTACGLDSMDVATISTPTVVGGFIVNWQGKGKEGPTYRDYFNQVSTTLHIPEYVAMKQDMAKAARIMEKKASAATWDADTKPLLELAFTQEELNEARELMLNNKYEQLTYREVFFEYTSIKKSTLENKQHNELQATEASLLVIKATYAPYCDTSLLAPTPYNLLAFQSYSAGLQCAKKMNRTALVYFTGVNCVNARKMEAAVLQNEGVKKVIESRMVLISLACDDRRPAKPSERKYSKVLKGNIETVGDINAELQLGKFNANSQPLFVLLNGEGKVVATQAYTAEPAAFEAFLAKAAK